MPLTSQQQEIYSSITEFVISLKNLYRSPEYDIKVTPLNVFERFLATKASGDDEKKLSIIQGFVNFYTTNKTHLLEGTPLPKNTCIFHSEKRAIHLQISYYIEMQTDKEVVNAIYQHLILICSMIEMDADIKAKLKERYDSYGATSGTASGSGFGAAATPFFDSLFKGDNSEESRFFSNLVSKVSTIIPSYTDASADPMATAMNLISSGAIQNLFSGENDLTKTDPRKMKKLIKNLVNTLLKDDDDEDEVRTPPKETHDLIDL
mgnify:CR=1 FL=1